MLLENEEKSEDFIDFSSDEGEKYIKDGETNIYEKEFANGFPQDYSDLLIEIILSQWLIAT